MWYGCGAFSWAKQQVSDDCRSAQRQDWKNARKTVEQQTSAWSTATTHQDSLRHDLQNSEVHFDFWRFTEQTSWLSRCHSLHLTVTCRGRGLTVLLPATSAGGPFWPASHYKRHSWGRGRSLSSSACSGVLLAAPDDRQHGEDVDMTVNTRREGWEPPTFGLVLHFSSLLGVVLFSPPPPFGWRCFLALPFLCDDFIPSVQVT